MLLKVGLWTADSVILVKAYRIVQSLFGDSDIYVETTSTITVLSACHVIALTVEARIYV